MVTPEQALVLISPRPYYLRRRQSPMTDTDSVCSIVPLV
jgi:hypothetical protein